MVASLEPVVGRDIKHPGFGEMVCQGFRLARFQFRKSLLKSLGNLTVQLLSPSLKQTLVRRISHQCVFESVDSVGWLTMTEHQLRLLKFAKCVVQRGLI